MNSLVKERKAFFRAMARKSFRRLTAAETGDLVREAQRVIPTRTVWEKKGDEYKRAVADQKTLTPEDD